MELASIDACTVELDSVGTEGVELASIDANAVALASIGAKAVVLASSDAKAVELASIGANAVELASIGAKAVVPANIDAYAVVPASIGVGTGNDPPAGAVCDAGPLSEDSAERRRGSPQRGQREPPSAATLKSALKVAAVCALAFNRWRFACEVGKARRRTAELEAAAAEATVASRLWEEQDAAR